MTTKTHDIHGKIEKIAEQARQGAVQTAEQVVDAGTHAADVVAEKTREQTRHVGERVVATGEKILKLVK